MNSETQTYQRLKQDDLFGIKDEFEKRVSNPKNENSITVA